jgi:hypothetical protein
VTADPSGYLESAAAVAADLRTLGLDPVLVGGMALVVLGSRRVTRDFDFVIRTPAERLPDVVDALYQRGFELASRLDDAGEVVATIRNRTVAMARLRIDKPASAYFFNPVTLLRIDLLFDFPVPAATLAARASRMKIAGHVFEIASEPDLLQLKRIAKAARSFPGDAQDIAFLESRLQNESSGSARLGRPSKDHRR